MHTTQYPDSGLTYREGFIMNIGNKNLNVVDEHSSFGQQTTSSPLVFDSVKNK